MKKSLTGGVLNRINEMYRCNSKKNSVAIMNLIRYHKPKQRAELVALIEAHTSTGVHANCACGSRSAGTIKDFGMNLFKANLRYFVEKEPMGEVKTLEECETFMYNLFVVQSLKGNLMEDKAAEQLNKRMDNFSAEQADEESDFKYGVDLFIRNKEGDIVCGIQVKPISYMHIPDNHTVKIVNDKKTSSWSYPVYYLYYDLEGNWKNGTKTIEKINKLTSN